MKHNDAQPPLDAEMARPVFGGVVYKPMDAGRGGWDLFRPQPTTQAEQPSLLDMLETGYMHATYGEAAEEIEHE